MLRLSHPLYKTALAGVVSPYLNVRQPKVLADVLRSEATRANVNMIMQEVVRAHQSEELPIFPETRDLIQASAYLDPKAFSTNLINLVDMKKTNIPLFDEILLKANDGQKFEALKIAFKNNDMDSARKVLSSVKNQQKCLDKLFLDGKNDFKFSPQMIREFLPLCSENVQSRFLKEMIIQQNVAAVDEIIAFYEPKDDHKKLAKIHFSSPVFLRVYNRARDTVRDRVDSFSGMINVSLVAEMKNSVKKAGKQLMETARETTKLALRRMGLLAPGKEIVVFEKSADLESQNGLVYGRNNASDFDDEENLELTSGSPLLGKAGVSLAKSMKQAMLNSSFVAQLGEKARIALPSGTSSIVDELDEESGDFYTLPRVYTDHAGSEKRGGGRIALGGAAVVGLATVLNRSTKEEVVQVQPTLEPENSSEKKEETVEPEIALAPLVESSLKTEEAPSKIIDIPVKIEQNAEVINLDQESKTSKSSNRWADGLAQMKIDRSAGYWRL